MIDHVAPIWAALGSNGRGTFWVPTRDLVGYAATRGVTARVGAPTGRRRLLVASWGDVPPGRRFVMIEHGAGQSYGGNPEPGSTPDYGHTCGLDLIVVPNAACAYRNTLHHPHAAVVVASPRVEALCAVRAGHVPAGVPTVAFAWHWNAPGPAPEARWAWPHWRDTITELAAMPDRGYDLLGHGHPRAFRHLRHWYRRSGIVATPDPLDVIRRADVVVFDSTSFGWEAAAVGIPVVLLDAPWFRPGVDHGLRWWTHADAGIRVGTATVGALHGAITATLAGDPRADARASAVADVYPTVAGSTTAAAAAIRALVV